MMMLSPADTGNVPVVWPVMYEVPEVREKLICETVPPWTITKPPMLAV
jgi:hypothetical protein